MSLRRAPHVPPVYRGTSFNCPLCSAYAAQGWRVQIVANGKSGSWTPDQLGDTEWVLATSRCSHCYGYAVWHSGKMIYPESGVVSAAHPDTPPDIAHDYGEATNIVMASPRGAAALLRLAIQKLCAHLGEKGGNINDDIAGLVKKGLPSGVQKALDTVRVIGNEAVHPGTIDLRDTPEVALKLFGLVNFIVEKMITEPKEIEELYGALPAGKLAAITQRDGKS
jgi:hypothetical protein